LNQIAGAQRLQKCVLIGGFFAATLGLSYGQAVQSLSVSPASLTGGSSATGTVTLAATAGTSGQVVNISSSSSNATVGASVKVSAGKQTATFRISTVAVAADTTSTITASDSAGKATTTLKVLAPKLTLLAFKPSTLLGGESSVATVKISSAAPSNGIKVSLKSSSSAFKVPASITIPKGATSATLTVTPLPVAKNTTANVTATLGTSTIQVPVTVEAPTLTKLVLNPTSVQGLSKSTGTLTISGPAPSAGLKITLASSSTLATVPKTVTIASSATTATFTVNAAASLTKVAATITATDPSLTTEKATLTVLADLTQVVNIPVVDIAYDTVNDKIWAAVDSTGGKYANCLVAVDPQTGMIGKSINIGVTPGRIAVTDNGQYAYIQMPADGTIRRANLTTDKVDAIYRLGFGSISDIEAVPGEPGSFLIATDPTFGVNTTVWDGDKVRGGTGAGGYTVKFAGSSALMYGDGHGGMFTDTLTSKAITWTAQDSLNVSGFEYYNHLLYTAVPTVVDPVQKIVVESLPTTNFLVDREVAVSQADNRIYYVTWSATNNKRILCFNLKTYQEIPFRDVGPLPGGCLKPLACGHHTVAFFIFGSGVTQNLIIIHNLK